MDYFEDLIGLVIANDELDGPTSYSLHKNLTNKDIKTTANTIEFNIGDKENAVITFTTDEYKDPIDRFWYVKFDTFYKDDHVKDYIDKCKFITKESYDIVLIDDQMYHVYTPMCKINETWISLIYRKAIENGFYVDSHEVRWQSLIRSYYHYVIEATNRFHKREKQMLMKALITQPDSFEYDVVEEPIKCPICKMKFDTHEKYNNHVHYVNPCSVMLKRL